MPDSVLNFRIQTTGEQATLATIDKLDQSATRTGSRFDQAANRITGAFTRMQRGSAALDAIRRRTDLLAEGLTRASTRSSSLTRLTGAESQLQAALTRGNLSLEQRIRLERELLRVQGALASQRPAAVVAAPVGVGGRATTALAGAATSARTALTGFAGGMAGAFALTSALSAVRAIAGAITGSASAADELETALRKLNAASRLTGIDINLLREQALGAQEAFLLTEVQAVDLTAATVRLTQRAGDATRAGALMTAWLDLAAANGQSADEALQGLNTTLIGQDEGLNRLGLANPQQIYEKWGRAAGTSAAKMTEAEKAQAIVNEVVEVGSKVTGEYEKSLKTAAGATKSMALAFRGLQAEIGKILEPLRIAFGTRMAEMIRSTRAEIALVADAISTVKDWADAAAGAMKRMLSGMPDFRDAKGGSSSTANDLPDIVVTGTEASEAANQRTAELVRAIELGTADNAMRREAVMLSRAYAAAAKNEAIAQEIRNQHAERAKALTEALNAGAKANANALTERTAALIALTNLEGPQVDRWAVLIGRAEDLQRALDKGNLSYEKRVEVLTELRAIEAATFPSTLPEDQMRGRGEIRRNRLRPEPMAPMVLPGGEGSIYSRMVENLTMEGLGLDEAVRELEAQLKSAAEGLAATFEGALVGAFAALGSGAGIGEAIAGFAGQMLSAIGEMAIKFGLAAMGIGALMEKIMAALASLNPIVAIAAGAALVALGAALSSAASRSFGGGTGVGSTAPAPITNTYRVTTSGSPGSAPTAARSAGQPLTVNVTHFGGRDPGFQRWITEQVRGGLSRGVGG